MAQKCREIILARKDKKKSVTRDSKGKVRTHQIPFVNNDMSIKLNQVLGL